jgi:hypothetical protein
MRRSALLALVSTLFAVGCSSGAGGGASSADPGSSVDPTQSDVDGGSSDPGAVQGGSGSGKGADAGADAKDAGPQVTPDGCPVAVSPKTNPCVLRNELGVFASSSKGSDTTGDGTMGAPFATAAHAIAFAQAHQKRVFLCAETYAEQVTFVDGVSVYGGLDCSAAQWKVVDTRAHFDAPASPAAKADNVQNTTIIEAMEIVAPDATTPSGSSIGMIATISPALSLVNVLVKAGNAANGADGVVDPTRVLAPHFTAPGNGAAPRVPCTLTAFDLATACQTARAGGAGGTNYCGRGIYGGAGGAGGNGDAAQSMKNGAGIYVWDEYSNQGATSGKPGGVATGAAGANGSSATALGAFSSSGYSPGDGTSGTDGQPGGGGAGANGYRVTDVYGAGAFAGDNGLGLAGAGGGAGGCPGVAGAAGKGGGASVALLAIASPLQLVTSTVTSANGGAGGGGSGGDDSATMPQAGGQNPDSTGNGGLAGGVSGYSGSGAGGPSIAIAYTGGAPQADATTTSTPGNPGAGHVQITSNGKTIPASAAGVSQAMFSF